MAPRVALFLSPHLDDVAFSCGGLAALLADAGWHTIMATLFTRSVHPAKGFALACQLDKGLPPDTDYMALRRAEDTQAAGTLGITELHWMDLPEAPHRGYGSAPELFASVRPDDTIAVDVAACLQSLDAAHHPELVLAPQALGRHVDHQIVAACALQIFEPARLAWYRDTPYAIREPDSISMHAAPDWISVQVDISAVLERRIAASSAYATQIGFQFGTRKNLACLLRAFALREGSGAWPAERISTSSPHCALAMRGSSG